MTKRPTSHTSQFDTISKEEGAVSATTRRKVKRASTGVDFRKLSPKGKIALACMGICAALVIGLVSCAFMQPSTFLESSYERQEVVNAGAGEVIMYDGYEYQLAQNPEGTQALFTRGKEGSEAVVVARLDGAPAALVLYHGAFLLGVNNGESHNVYTWTIGDGSKTGELDGASGEGTMSGMQVVGASLRVSLSNGSEQTAPLE